MSKHTKYIFGIIVFLITFIIYNFTLSKTVYYTDAGELASAAYYLGIAHPTGYPLFTILAHLWSYLPISDSIIHSFNIFAAFLVAFSSSIIFLIIWQILSNIISNNYKIYICFIISLTFSFSFTMWQQSTSIEVYPLQILLFSLIIFLSIKAHYSSDIRCWLLTAFLIGLSFTNHLTTLFIVPSTLYLFFFEKNKLILTKNKFKDFLLIIITFFLPLSLYLSIVIRSASYPPINWGWIHRSFEKFLYHVQGKQYQVWMFSGDKINENVQKFIELIPYQFAFIGVLFIILALYYLIKIKEKQLLTYLLINIVFSFLYAINYSIHDIDSYFSLSFISLFFIIPFGVLYLYEKYKKLIFIIIILPLINLFINYQKVDISNNYLVEDYTKQLINNLDSNAILITAQWDYFNSAFMYYQSVEKVRPDIVIVEKELLRRTWYPLQLEIKNPELTNLVKLELERYKIDLEKFESGQPIQNYPYIQNNYINLLRRIIETNIYERPVYVGLDILQSEQDIIKGFNLYPVGLVYKITNDSIPDKYKFDIEKFNRFIENSQKAKNYLDSGIINIAYSQILNSAKFFEAYRKLNASIKAYEICLKFNPNNSEIKESVKNIKKQINN